MESSPRIERTLPPDEQATVEIEPPRHGLRPAVIRAFLASLLILVLLVLIPFALLPSQ